MILVKSQKPESNYSFIGIFQVISFYFYHQIVTFSMALRYIQTLKMTSYLLVHVAVTVIVAHARVQVLRSPWKMKVRLKNSTMA
jgi:hypothetical protein